MIECKVVHEVKSKTAYLGDEYSYSHAAAKSLSDGELISFGTLSQAVFAVGKTCDCCVVPVENNVEGAVNEVYDALFDSGLYIERQLVLPVRHSFIVKTGTEIQDVTRVMSHAQAIGQCRRFLETLGKNVTVVAAPSTSEALKHVDEHTAAIAFKPREGQTAIAKSIQDSATNATRFSLLSKTRSTEGKTVSIAFDLKNEPGALLDVLSAICNIGINLTRILSRPHRDGSGKYRFFIDFDFDKSASELDGVLSGIALHCMELRYLGRYNVDTADF